MQGAYVVYAGDHRHLSALGLDRAHHAPDFGMPLVAHEQHLIALIVQLLGGAMHFGDERAGYVQNVQTLRAGLRDDGRRDAVRR